MDFVLNILAPGLHLILPHKMIMVHDEMLDKLTNKFISKATCMSFPLVGNLSEKEGFWTSQNDRDKTSE